MIFASHPDTCFFPAGPDASGCRECIVLTFTSRVLGVDVTVSGVVLTDDDQSLGARRFRGIVCCPSDSAESSSDSRPALRR